MERLNKKRKKIQWLPKRGDLPFLLLLLPAVVTVILFSYYPMTGLLVAFKDYNAKKGVWGSEWAAMSGFANFAEIFKTPGLPESIWNTLYWNVLSLVIGFPLPIIFALMLDEVRNKPFKSVTQTISYLPHFLSWIAITGMAQSLLGKYGIINDLVYKLTENRIDFLGNGNYFLPVYLFVLIWQSLGWDSIIFLSALSSIPQEMYEAAKIDGASRLQQIIHITIPSIMPTAMILLIMKVGGIFGSNFELVYGLQNPAWTTEVISTAVYNYGIKEGKYSMATALSLIQGLVALILTMVANKVSKKTTSIAMW